MSAKVVGGAQTKRLQVLYGTTKGASKAFAGQLVDFCNSQLGSGAQLAIGGWVGVRQEAVACAVHAEWSTTALSMAQYDPEDLSTEQHVMAGVGATE